MPGRRPLVALAALALFAVAWAWTLAQSVPRSDDLVYMDWALAHPAFADIWASPPPFPGRRILNGAAWWLTTRLSERGEATAAVEAGLWLFALFAWAGFARARANSAAAAWTGALMLANPWFRDLPTWRSWMTSTGALAFFGAALWAAERKRPILLVILGLAAIGFKETVALPLVVASLLVYRRWAPALVLALAMLPGFLGFSSSNDHYLPPDFPAHVANYLGFVGASVSLPVISLGAAAPLLAALGPAARDLAVPAGALTLISGAWVAARSRSAWGPVVAVTLALPLLYRFENPAYLLDGTLVVSALSGVALASGRLPAWVGVLALAASIGSWDASLENARWQKSQWALSGQILADLEASRAFHLADDAPDLARFVAFRLKQQGWTTLAEPGPVELCKGLTSSP